MRLAIFCLVVWCFGVDLTAYVVPLRTQTQVQNGKLIAEAVYGTQILARFLGNDGDQSAEERANVFCQNIRSMLANGWKRAHATIDLVSPTTAEVTVDGHPLFTVTEAEAKGNQTLPDVLAAEWLDRLSEIFDRLPGYHDTDYGLTHQQLPVVTSAIIRPDMAIENTPYTAMMAGVPIGTKIRVINPEKKWSVVVEVDSHIAEDASRLVYLDPVSARAVGVRKTSPTQVMLEQVR